MPPRSPNTTALLSDSGSGFDEGRFPAGTMLLDRYRVLGLLGRGGMGEVYRANDLVLGQQVALKFLPAAMLQSRAMISRFQAEVRISRQVSHKNVCCVYDIGEIEGQVFLSMEYIDGEDLGTLLKRIGRLPSDKALELARGICAGLAAAHEKGVLHRDLKPANIMVNGQGNAVLMDFGLAAMATEVKGNDIRSGTPAYMAPEQLAGKEVSLRSDIYALGLVLHEMFIGRKAFEADSVEEMTRKQAAPDELDLTSVVKDLDPAVQRAIRRCLDPDPEKRPAGALTVSAALPGGDPLAMALAAGETPSPDLVARSGSHEGLHPAFAIGLFCLTIAALVGFVFVEQRVGLLNHVRLDNRPDVLAAKAQEITRKFGYDQPPADQAYGFQFNHDHIAYLRRTRVPKDGLKFLEKLRPSIALFWYRQSPRPLVPVFSGQSQVTLQNPPTLISGMVSILTDSQGRLLSFTAVPPQKDESPPEPEPNWSTMFEAAGLDFQRFEPAEPYWNPLVASDVRRAWTGPLPSSEPNTLGEMTVRIEAGAWRGKPVYFQEIDPWDKPYRLAPAVRSAASKAGNLTAVVLLIGVIGFAAFLARGNARQGRADLRGAYRVAAVAFIATAISWAFGSQHHLGIEEMPVLYSGLMQALFSFAMCWVLYAALEPFVRRRWPQTLVSWSRALLGEWRDPGIARDVLLGVAAGALLNALFKAASLISLGAGVMPPVAESQELIVLSSARYFMSNTAGAVLTALGVSLGVFLFVFLLRVLLRRDWLTGVVFVIVFTAQSAPQSPDPLFYTLVSALMGTCLIWILLRLGLLAFVMAHFVLTFLSLFPLTLDTSHWYWQYTLVPFFVLGGIAFVAMRNATRGHRLFKSLALD